MVISDINEQDIKKIINKYTMNIFAFGFSAGIAFSSIVFILVIMLSGR